MYILQKHGYIIKKGENNNALKELNKSLEILPNDVQF